MSSDEELEKLRQRRIAELQARGAQQEQSAQAQAEAQKEAVLRKILTPEARARLQNVKLVRPDFAAQVELQLIQVAQTGRVPLPITDDLLKKLLAELQSQVAKRDINIRRV
ncbi:MAG: DNA-binding protein [Candidatus Bathyarchaeota archaeon]